MLPSIAMRLASKGFEERSKAKRFSEAADFIYPCENFFSARDAIMKSGKWVIALCFILLLAGSPAFADTPPADPNSGVYTATIATLVKLFAVAILIESALAVIFNWRVFLTLFDGRGWKTVIMIVVSWLVVREFKIDWLSQLMTTYGAIKPVDDTIATILTSLVLAGGSSGIYNVLVKLGYRAPVAADRVEAKPPPEKAWIAIEVTQVASEGNVNIMLQKLNPQPAPMPTAIAGVVGGNSLAKDVWGLFFRDRMRFPRGGGYVVDPDVAYDLRVEAKNADGVLVPCPINGQYTFARGAIVNMKVTL
jgi:hypothetical protein